jgi:hypothetical protein
MLVRWSDFHKRFMLVAGNGFYGFTHCPWCGIQVQEPIPEAEGDGPMETDDQRKHRHCGGGNFSIVGPFAEKRALAVFLVASLANDDERVDKVLAVLGQDLLEGEKPPPKCHKSGGGDCTRDDRECHRLGHCVFDKCSHGCFYNEVCVPCGRLMK